ncbi:uncharacterized protein LOC106673959 [Cimex lectularius]|uniref:Uncharacterized protein n=1 Tax=Cimex lectularius TaxID=79782 RepID=A0A8I6SI60_CIMLE|nr:uncharacterized protein LOC106673959 [Cimex lectularius]
MHLAECLLGLSALYAILIPRFASAVIIQAEIDLDDHSELLIGNLINKVDAIIDPNIADSVNATKELAYALLNIGPLLSVKGNISDRSNTFSFSFNLDAVAGVVKSLEMNAVTVNEQNLQCSNKKDNDENGYIDEIVLTLESYMISIFSLIGHAIMTNVIANLMSDLALHSDTNLIF